MTYKAASAFKLKPFGVRIYIQKVPYFAVEMNEIYLHVAIKGDTAIFLVAVNGRGQRVGLGEGTAGSDGAALTGFHTSHAFCVVSVGHRNLHVLDNSYLCRQQTRSR